VTKANPEDRLLSEEMPHVLDGVFQWLGVAGTV
jgi:hypothetical protein